jgi:small-conductance mechanosensitive channel
MVSTDRRNPLNAKLRAKIDHIQQLSRQLQSSIEQIQEETVARARQGEVTDLPCQKFAARLSPAFQQQRAALDQIQQEIKGASVGIPLITDEELAALMG